MGGDGSEAWKTGEEKELVYGKILVKNDVGVLPCTFLLACQSLKEFGGAGAGAVRDGMLDACSRFLEFEELKKKVVCLCADGASVNMGRHKGALNQLSEMMDTSPYILYCFTHNLELAIKDSYKREKAFEEVKDVLFKMMKDSGKTWRIFQEIGERIGVKVLRFTKVSGTRFQPHVRRGLSNFLRNFLCLLLFAQNVEEQGSGKDALVTKIMYPKIIGYRKKWNKFEWVATATLCYRVLIETTQLSLNMESDSILIYQLYEKIREMGSNITQISEETNYEYLPSNMKINDKETENNDSIAVQVTSGTATDTAEQPSDEFILKNVQKAVDKLRQEFLPSIKSSVEDRFKNILEEESIKATKIFDVDEWGLGEVDPEH